MPSTVTKVDSIGGILVQHQRSLLSSLIPFEVLYVHPPRHFKLTPVDASSLPDVASLMEERAIMLALVRQHLLRAQ